MTISEAKLVIVDWNDLLLIDGDDRSTTSIHGQIEEAYGPNGVGILGIRHVPNFIAAKDRVLRFAHALASLPNEYLENELTDPKVSVLLKVSGGLIDWSEPLAPVGSACSDSAPPHLVRGNNVDKNSHSIRH
jgi:hypothetical protein